MTMGRGIALAGTIIGAAVGYALAPATGGTSAVLSSIALGAALGGTVGGIAGTLYDTSTAPDNVSEQQSLADLSVTTSTLGQAIPQVFGTFGGIAGNIFWATDKQEVQHRTEESASGKGGGPSNVTITKTYTMSFAMGLCDTLITGPMGGISKIWRNGGLFYDHSQNASLPTGWTFYPGSATQAVSPLVEAALGVGNTPAWRYLCYVTVEDDDLGQSGALNNYTFALYQETIGSAALSCLAVSPVTGDIWVNVPVIQQVWQFNETTRERVASWTISTADTDGFLFAPLAVDSAGLVWAGNVNPNSRTVNVIDPGVPTTSTEIATTDRPASNIVFSAGDAWMAVSNDTSTTDVLRMSSAGSIVATIPVSFSSGPRLAVDGSGNIWCVSGDQLKRIAPGSNTVTATVTGMGNGSDIAVGSDGNLWVPNGLSNVVYRIDHTGTPAISNTVTVGTTPVGVRLASDSFLWSANQDGSISRINPTTNTAVTYTIPGVSAQSSFEHLLAPGTSGRMWVLSPGQNTATLVTPTGVTAASRVGGQPFDMAQGASNTVWVTSVQGHQLQQLTESGSVQGLKTGNSLDTVLTNVHAACGLTSGDLDLSLLPSNLVNAMLTSVQAARAFVAQLAQAYRFYQVESGMQLAYREIGSSVVSLVIPETALDVGENQSPGQSLLVTRLDDIQFPTELDVNYISVAQNYQASTQRGLLALQTTDFETPRVESLSLVLSDAEAKQLAQEHIYEIPEQREPSHTTLSRKYAYLEPGDCGIQVQARGLTYDVTVAQTTYGRPGILEVDLVPDTSYLRGALGAVPGLSTPGTQSSLPAGPTSALLLNLPAMDAGDTTPRYHVAFQGATSPWPGAALYRSVDGGSSYQQVAVSTLEGIVGDVALNLAAPPTEHLVDDTNVLHVVLRKPTQTLHSVTDAAMAAGQNLAALVSSDGTKTLLLSFGTATLTAPGEYDLSHILQGRRGTEYLEGTIGTNAVFVLLDAGVQPVAMLSSDVGVSRSFKSVTAGGDIAAVSPTTFTPTSPNLVPWAAANVDATLNGVGSWDISWCYVPRFGGDWVPGYNTTYDSDFQGFQVDVFDDGTFTTVVRSTKSDGGHPLEPTATKHWLWTAVMQTADLGSPQAVLYFRVYQIGVGGLGTALNVTKP